MDQEADALADFIPNDDVGPARKLRIKKALERGAKWIKEWDSEITHVIVDKSLSYSDILKFLKVPSISVCGLNSRFLVFAHHGSPASSSLTSIIRPNAFNIRCS